MKKTIFTSVMLALIGLSNVANAQTFQWAKQMGGSSADEGASVTLDGFGNIYTTGSFKGTTDFDPGPLTFTLTSAGDADIFISKLDAAGNFLWAKQLGGTGIDVGYSIIHDGSGNIYATGSFSGTVDFDPGAVGTFYLTSSGNSDIFIFKLDATGGFMWAKQMGGIGYDQGNFITLDGLGNIYTTGDFRDSVDFDPGPLTFTLTSTGNYDIFISKLDATGNFVWAKHMGGTSADRSKSISTDASGNVYRSCSFLTIADFDPGMGTVNLTSAGNTDIFISKLDAAGDFVWAKQMGGTGIDYGTSISLDAAGNIYTTGYFSQTADFDPGTGTSDLISAGLTDIFILKLDAAADFVWAKGMGGTQNDQSYSISHDASGNVYTTGYFQGTADFDPGSATSNLTSAGNYDLFIAKLNTAGNFVWATQIGGTGADQGSSITLDASGNIYTTGYFQVTADFDPGSATFNLTSLGGTDIFISKLYDPTTGIAEEFKNSDLRIYPNPIKNVVYFSSTTNVQISNLTGQIVVVENNVNILDLSKQPTGMYFITLSDNNGQVIQKSKLVKE